MVLNYLPRIPNACVEETGDVELDCVVSFGEIFQLLLPPDGASEPEDASVLSGVSSKEQVRTRKSK